MKLRLTDENGRTLLRGETEPGIEVMDLMRTSHRGRLNFLLEPDEPAEKGEQGASGKPAEQEGNRRRGGAAQ